MQEPLKIFISYAREDYRVVRRLYDSLRDVGYKPWMDKVDLLAGAAYEKTISKVLRASDLFIVCLSSNSVNKRSFIQREIMLVLDIWEEKLGDDSYIIPVRLDKCTPPDRIAQFNSIDLFGEDVEAEWEKLLRSINYQAERLGKFKVAQQTLFAVIGQDLQKIGDLQGLAQANELLKSLPTDSDYSPETQKRINDIARKAQDYLKRTTIVGQITILEELHDDILAFLINTRWLSPRSVADIEPIVEHWLDIATREVDRVRQQLTVIPIPNPFIVGNPLQTRDEELFRGRKDIIVAIEENIINAKQRPALLLYGRRRTGKSSTLLNLPRLLSSQFVPVFINCQDAKLWSSDEEFCFHLATAIFNELRQRDLLDGLRQPRFENFEKYAFTRLDEFLNDVETLSRKIKKQILLTFDEYERLEIGVTKSKISEAVLNQLRTLIQHRERIVVLVSGSHRFEELKAVNWSDYLINAKTLELSFLAEQDARELLTEPVPNLEYGEGVLEKIIALTHCQPYLLQAVASDLVNYLNLQKRQHATPEDLVVAVEKVLTTADGYFFNTWNDCSAAEQTVMRAFAKGAGASVLTAEFQAAIQGLMRKEILEKTENGYRLAVELFGRWIVKNQVAEALPERVVS